MYLVVTIDTEEDNWGEYDRASYSVENIARIPQLQRVFDRHAIRPTYLISYPVATSRMAVQILKPFQDAGACEIGTHPHPWNTPPASEARTVANSFIHHLPVDLQYEKLRSLHEAIASNFGVVPRSYRSGRWGFNDNIARHLVRLGYVTDSSLSPVTDWSEYGGPDHSHCGLEPFVYQVEAPGQSTRALLELPPTVDFLQAPRRAANAIYWGLRRRGRAAGKFLAGLNRLRLLNHVSLSPELHDAAQMIRLARTVLARGATVLNMFFHSPSLLEGCSPFVRTRADVDDFIARIESFLEFARACGLRSASLSELTPPMVRASTVKFLPDSPAM